ncbi:MAG TPA: sulfotransferase domain-containing protein [Sphingomicrobium sp.]|nr:sulfotransferase domain-containing protein [Sphingomicrobium sp.]
MTNLAMRAAAQVLRLVPGSTALRLKRDLRDAAWLADADAAVVSYPKSGRTFVRAMLARLYKRRFGIDERSLLEFPSLRRAPAGVPLVLFSHGGDAMRRPDQIHVNPADYLHKKVVLIARHPGDIAVSRYHHLKHRSRDVARQRLAEQPLEPFVWTEQGGIPSIVTFLNQFAALPGVTILRYEDFLAEPTETLRRLAKAVGLAVSDDDIADAVEFGSLPNLKKLEHEGYFTSSRLRRARKDDEQSGKVRQGTSGGYREQLGEAAAERIDAYIDEHLDRRFGYSA